MTRWMNILSTSYRFFFFFFFFYSCFSRLLRLGCVAIWKWSLHLHNKMCLGKEPTAFQHLLSCDVRIRAWQGGGVHSGIRILQSSPFRGSGQGVQKKCTCKKPTLGRQCCWSQKIWLEITAQLLWGVVCTSHVTSGTSVSSSVRCRVGKGGGGKG